MLVFNNMLRHLRHCVTSSAISNCSKEIEIYVSLTALYHFPIFCFLRYLVREGAAKEKCAAERRRCNTTFGFCYIH